MAYIKNLLIIVFLLVMTLRCSGEDTPDGGNNNDGSGNNTGAGSGNNGNGGTGSFNRSYVEDNQGQFLGYLMSGSDTDLTLLSKNGYVFHLYYDATYPNYPYEKNQLYTNNETMISADNMYISALDYYALKSVYYIMSESGGITGAYFCTQEGFPVNLDVTVKYLWSLQDKAKGYKYTRDVGSAILDEKGYKLELCTSSEVGIPEPDNITLPYKVIWK